MVNSRTRLAGAAVLLMAAALLGVSPGSAHADTPGCGVANADHCYEWLEAGSTGGTLYAGSYGTWNRAAMVSGCSASTPYRFVVSTHWFAPYSGGWVEAGHAAGFVAGHTGDCDYWAYAAWQKEDGSGYTERSLARLNHNDSVTDEFQISRTATTNVFYAYFNGNRLTTSNVQFWNSRRVQMGGEVATAVGTSHTFNMQGKVITQGGSFVNLPTPQTEERIDPQDVLYGNSPGNSAFTWRIRP